MERSERPDGPERPEQQPTARSGPSSSDRPWHREMPPPPVLPPHLAGGVDLRVGKRLLWVGGAAYPTANITRVYTFLLTPRRGDATARFFKRVGIILLVALALVFVTDTVSDSETAEIVQLLNVATVMVLIYCVGDWVSVLIAPSHWVLAVETSGASTALVTGRDTQHLHQLVGQVVKAIENPDIEFQVRVESLTVNPRNYHFGDNVNMYGGSGNVGMRMS
ncbi:DUF6232 family protein [Streptomyces sp. NPDC018026]|uniref:DUF6232 family protein n=1 Tax=Streptomyces sp. NPDC018026 TaxID=3365031 RepID=UPI00379BB05C